MFFLFLCGSRTAGGGKREKMAKFEARFQNVNLVLHLSGT